MLLVTVDINLESSPGRMIRQNGCRFGVYHTSIAHLPLALRRSSGVCSCRHERTGVYYMRCGIDARSGLLPPMWRVCSSAGQGLGTTNGDPERRKGCLYNAASGSAANKPRLSRRCSFRLARITAAFCVFSSSAGQIAVQSARTDSRRYRHTGAPGHWFGCRGNAVRAYDPKRGPAALRAQQATFLSRRPNGSRCHSRRRQWRAAVTDAGPTKQGPGVV